MRTFALIIAGFAAAVLGSTGSAQSVASNGPQQTYVCPQCGKLHVRPAVKTVRPAQTTPNVPTAALKTVASSIATTPSVATAISGATSQSGRGLAGRVVGGVSNVLGALNAQRSRQGIASLLYDSQLQAVAQRRAQRMAASGLKSHPSGSFSPGRYEGVGWSSSYSPSGVSACFTSDTRMRYAGAAMATGRDGVYFAVVYR